MAVFEFHFYAEELGRYVSALAILPTDGWKVHPERIETCYQRPMKSLYLLSGYSGSHMDWLNYTQLVTYCYKYNVASFLVGGENSFYLNDKRRGAYYENFVAKDIVDYTRKTFAGLSRERECTWIGGNSMGGFGALYLGFKHPEIFGMALSLSPAIVCYGYNEEQNLFLLAGIEESYCRNIFGTPEEAALSDYNLEVLYKKQKEKGMKLPEIYLTCGNEDLLVEQSRRMSSFLKKEGADAVYRETEGDHMWDVWNLSIEDALRWAVRTELA